MTRWLRRIAWHYADWEWLRFMKEAEDNANRSARRQSQINLVEAAYLGRHRHD